jgi:hypothetical protein
MSNRMLRDWTDSERVCSLSAHAERFFVRLIMKADDFGCYHAEPKLLRPFLFPMQLTEIREADIQRWIAECVKAGVVRLYKSSGKPYLEIIEFNQRLRAKHRKFPERQTHDGHMTDICPPEEKRREVEEEVEVKKKFSPPSLEEVKAYCVEHGYLAELGDKVFRYYDSADWKDSKGNQVKNWKQKINGVWFKDEFKAPFKTKNRYVSVTTPGAGD